MGYEHLENQGTHGAKSPVLEDSDYPSNPTVNGKLKMLNGDNDDDELELMLVLYNCYVQLDILIYTSLFLDYNEFMERFSHMHFNWK